jgi:hypothetical protein
MFAGLVESLGDSEGFSTSCCKTGRRCERGAAEHETAHAPASLTESSEPVRSTRASQVRRGGRIDTQSCDRRARTRCCASTRGVVHARAGRASPEGHRPRVPAHSRDSSDCWASLSLHQATPLAQRLATRSAVSAKSVGDAITELWAVKGCGDVSEESFTRAASLRASRLGERHADGLSDLAARDAGHR